MLERRIGIDCRMINESGIGRYIENLILNLNEIDSNTKYILFVLDKNNFHLKLNNNFELVDANYIWHSFAEQTKFLKVINSFNLDLYHSPHPNMPYFYKKNFVVTIHDLTMLKKRTGRASTYGFLRYTFKWLVFKIMLTWSVKRASKIITVSYFVKDQIIKEFKLDQSKVEVIYNGVSESIFKISDHNKIAKVRERFNITKPFLFYVGNAYPHKNLERLILAFKLLNKEGEYQLVLGGKEDFFYSRIKKDYADIRDITFTGYLTDMEISILYSSCEAFVYPSISEGFGIQIIESLKVGCKVICSNNSVFPEIAKNFAYYFNPMDVEDICKSIKIALKKPSISKSIELTNHLLKFDWKISAQKHYEVYQKY